MCVAAAKRAGHIIREVTSAGQLGVIDKVSLYNIIITQYLECRQIYVQIYIAICRTALNQVLHDHLI